MDLEAGVARLGHHRVLAHAQLVGALDVQLVVLTAQPHEGVVEGEVARVLDHVGDGQVALANRRERSGEDDVQPRRLRRRPPEGEQLVELCVHAGEAVAAELLGIEVELEIEGTDLGRVGVAGEGGEHRQRAGGGLPRRVDEEHLLLGADSADTSLEAVLAQHRLQRLEVAEHPANCRLPVGPSCRRLMPHYSTNSSRYPGSMARHNGQS